MQIVHPNITIEDDISGDAVLKKVERAARICYQSRPNDETRDQFIRNIIKNNHTSVTEHVHISVTIICNRGISHEIVRHRIAAYSMESTRYVNYVNKGMKFVYPIELEHMKYVNPAMHEILHKLWVEGCENSETIYSKMIEAGAQPQLARDVLDNAVKTQIMLTYNLHAWRNFFTQRCAKAAHPDMKLIAIAMLLYFREHIPVIFDDIGYDEEFWNTYVVAHGKNWHDYIIDQQLIAECDSVRYGNDFNNGNVIDNHE